MEEPKNSNQPEGEPRRDDLDPLSRAVADSLDDWMMRHHGILSSHHNAGSFLRLLAEEGYEVRRIGSDIPPMPSTLHNVHNQRRVIT